MELFFSEKDLFPFDLLEFIVLDQIDYAHFHSFYIIESDRKLFNQFVIIDFASDCHSSFDRVLDFQNQRADFCWNVQSNIKST